MDSPSEGEKQCAEGHGAWRAGVTWGNAGESGFPPVHGDRVCDGLVTETDSKS